MTTASEPTPDLTIYITAKDIRDGNRADCDHCPVAIATERAIKRVMGVTPDHVTVIHNVVAHIQTELGWINRWWDASEAVRKFIARFDGGFIVKPATFRLHGMADTAEG